MKKLTQRCENCGEFAHCYDSRKLRRTVTRKYKCSHCGTLFTTSTDIPGDRPSWLKLAQ